MKKLLVAGVAVAAAMAFNMADNKTYKCESVGISYNDGNQTRNIPVTPKTKPLLEKTLKIFFNIEATKKGDEVTVKVGKVSEKLKYTGKWKDYNKYENNNSSVIFMPDKAPKSNDAALIIPQEKLVIYYNCK